MRYGTVPVSAKDNGTEKFGPSDEKKFSFVPKKILPENFLNGEKNLKHALRKNADVSFMAT